MNCCYIMNFEKIRKSLKKVQIRGCKIHGFRV